VTLRNPHSGATVSDVLLLLDTGADVTLLPRTAVEQLGVPLLAGQQLYAMKLLLDMHTFLWFIDDSPPLSQKGKALLEADNALLFSIASLWEYVTSNYEDHRQENAPRILGTILV
jgi:hypothetical protein